METKDHNYERVAPWQIALIAIAPFVLLITTKTILYLVRKKCYKSNKTAPTNLAPKPKISRAVPTHVFGSSRG